MKALIMGLVLITSASAFAAPKNKCGPLSGKYTCAENGQNISVEISVKADKLQLTLNGNVENHTLDGTFRPTKKEGGTASASCIATELVVTDKFQGKSVSLMGFTPSEDGLVFSVVQGLNVFPELKCTRIE
jgi:hypothetical protein